MSNVFDRIFRYRPSLKLSKKEKLEYYFWRDLKLKEGTIEEKNYNRWFYLDLFGIPYEFYQGKRILDVGCGARGSLEWADNALERVGIDPLVVEYRKLGINDHNMTYVYAYSEDIPFPDNYFDVVASLNSLDHVNDLGLSIEEIKRVTRPNGTFLLLVDLNDPKSINHPYVLSPDVVDRFKPEFFLESLTLYGKTDKGPEHDVEKGIAYEPGKPGVLAARFSSRAKNHSKLNLGCGHDIRDGWINLDRFPGEGVDVVHDLNILPLPFPDNHFCRVDAKHVLEHIWSWEDLLQEIHRITKATKLVRIDVPYGFNCIPHHKRFFDEGTLDLFLVRDDFEDISSLEKYQLFRQVKKRVHRLTPLQWHFKHYLGINLPRYSRIGRKYEIAWVLEVVK